MTTPSAGTKLVNEVLENGDQDGSVVSQIYAEYEKKKPRIRSKLNRYPALRSVSATSVFHSVILRLRKAANYKEVKSGTAVLMSMSNKSIRTRNRDQLAGYRDPRKEDGSDAIREGLADTAPTPDEAASNREEVEIAERLLGEMSQADRDVLTLCEGEEMSFPEIGAAMGIMEETAQKRYKAAKKRLFAKMKRENLVP